MTSPPHLHSFPTRRSSDLGAVDYVVDHDVPGAFVEAGLWKGRSLMAVAMRLRDRGVTDRELIGFDTFTGMTDPGEEDRKSTRLNSSHGYISYAVLCLNKKR